MESFTHLRAWQSGIKLMKEVYALVRQLPKCEQYGLASQLRRAVTSILANTAEGFSRRSPPDKANKYTIARGECSETHALLLMCVELQYCDAVQVAPLIALAEETGKLLSGLIHIHLGRTYPTPYALPPTPQIE